MNINITISDLISWLIIGILAGSLAGMIVKRNKNGLGNLLNLLVGLVGAIIGGGVVRLLKLDFGLGKVVLRWEDMVAAIIGSLLLIILVSVLRKKV
jgi:uncharacterized membrane protein YeaQ/YmgE (transglycosylase-associated protein family)